MNWRPGRGFRLGAMRSRVNLQTNTPSVDSAGQPVASWANTYSNEPAEFTPTTGGERLRGRQIEAGVDAVFTIHYRDSVTPEMRVVHGSTNYGIVHVKRVEGGLRYLELHCKATA